MNISWFIFVTLLAMCILVGIAFVTPQVPYEDRAQDDGSVKRVILSHGFEHPQYASMQHGGPGAQRHEVTIWIGWAFAVANVLFYVGCLLLGATRHGKLGPAKAPFIIGTAVFMAIFTALIFSYRSYMTEETHSLFLSLPKPTAWMLLAVWPFPFYFQVVYFCLFDRWHFTEEDERRYEEIVARRSQATAEGP